MCLTPDRLFGQARSSDGPDGSDDVVLPVQLLIMAKAPVAGSVKTRLCPPLDCEEAALVARAALIDTLDAALAARLERVILVLDGEPGDWLRHEVDVQPQSAGDLAVRLEAAVRAVWSGTSLPVLVIGMDTPQITGTQLREAAVCLLSTGTDAVLGPAADGGFWAIGIRAPIHGVFADVAMSVPDTGRRQQSRLNDLGLRTRTLGVLRDVDEFSDAVEVARIAPASLFARTFAALHLGEGIEVRSAGPSR